MATQITNDNAIAQNTMAALISRTICALDDKTPGDDGTDYKSLYYGVYNGISTIIENTDNYGQMLAALKQLQTAAEDAYIEQTGKLSFEIPEPFNIAKG